MTFKFPAIRPVLPPMSEWEHYLQPAYDQRWFTNFGPVASQFEAALTEKFCHSGEVMTCANNATSAIAAALISIDVRGRVLVPAYTFPATAAAVLMAGAEPVVLDVDLETWAVSADSLAQALSSNGAAAVILVSPFGLAQDFAEHLAISRRAQVPCVIDNAAGLNEKGQPLPNDTSFEVYSLHATKPFPIGEGGAMRSHSSRAAGLRIALNFGLAYGEAQPGCWGINGKLPEVSAAVGLAVIENFDRILEVRRAAAARYIEELSGFEELRMPNDVGLGPWQVFPVLMPTASAAEKFVENAAAEGLQVRWSYKPSLDAWPRTSTIAPCPNARSLSARMVTLPVYSDVTEAELNAIIAVVRTALGRSLHP
jgi:dTDP-4-amino-4,6-dideoxygalactose transaminase